MLLEIADIIDLEEKKQDTVYTACKTKQNTER